MALKTRALTAEDLPEIKELHERYFSREFTLPDFTRMLGGFVITDSNDRTIMAGGVQPIGEILLVTNKEHPSKTELGRALVEAQNISRYFATQCHISELVAFVKDEAYARHLRIHGFRERCKALSLKV